MGIKTKVAREYCARFPKHGDNTIARKMLKDNPLVFDAIEDARFAIRYARGHAGAKNRNKAAAKDAFKPVTYDSNPYKLPESYAEPKEPYIIPTANNNILLISDLHIPYHDIKALTAALDYGKKHKINTVIINGDLLDFHMLSRFEKDPRKRSVKEEFDTCKEFLRVLRKTFPNAAIYWIKGNHDKRYEKWLLAKAPEVFDDPYYSLEERLRLNEERITLIDDLQLVKAGKLFITHGHLMINGVFAPVNAARGLYMRAKVSTIIAHTHSVSEHTEKDLKGDITTCWSMGCLCELQPDYSPFVNKYAHGFAHIRTEPNGDFSLLNYRIINGKLL